MTSSSMQMAFHADSFHVEFPETKTRRGDIQALWHAGWKEVTSSEIRFFL